MEEASVNSGEGLLGGHLNFGSTPFVVSRWKRCPIKEVFCIGPGSRDKKLPIACGQGFRSTARQSGDWCGQFSLGSLL